MGTAKPSLMAVLTGGGFQRVGENRPAMECTPFFFGQYIFFNLALCNFDYATN
jgi:hypothetical protein